LRRLQAQLLMPVTPISRWQPARIIGCHVTFSHLDGGRRRSDIIAAEAQQR